MASMVSPARSRLLTLRAGVGYGYGSSAPLLMASFWSLLSSSRMIVRFASCVEERGVSARRSGQLSWVNWNGRPPLGQLELPEAGELEGLCSRRAVPANVTIIPSTGSNVASARVEPAAGNVTSVAVGRALPDGQHGDPSAARRRRRHLGHAEELVDLTADLHEVAGRRPSGTSRGRTRTAPRRWPGRRRRQASSSWTKKPSGRSTLVNVDVTMPSTITSWPSSRLAGPAPCTVGDQGDREDRDGDGAADALRWIVVGAERDRHGVGAGGRGRGDVERRRAGSRRRQR